MLRGARGLDLERVDRGLRVLLWEIRGVLARELSEDHKSRAVLDAGKDSVAPWMSYFALGLTEFGILMSLLIAVRLAIGR